jgi:HflC protein
MQNMKTVGILVVVLIVLVGAGSVIYTVSETQQVVITQFGDYKREVKEAGLHFKMPIIEQVNYYEKRLLEWDGKAEQVPTLNKEYIWVDCFARWRIDDPLLFRTSVGREEAAHSRREARAETDGDCRCGVQHRRAIPATRRRGQRALTRQRCCRTTASSLQQASLGQCREG